MSDVKPTLSHLQMTTLKYCTNLECTEFLREVATCLKLVSVTT
jgi:hypothetical protein